MSGLRWHPPSTWPIRATGLAMAGIDDVLLVFAGESLTNEAYELHLRELANAIDRREDDTRIGVIYEDPFMALSRTPERRAGASRVLDARRDKLRKTTSGFVWVTNSAFSRAALRAYFQFSPPPYPWWVRGNTFDALVEIAKVMPGLDPDRVLTRWYPLIESMAA